ncbi:coiled-coil domain-containing protein 114 isoform X2 [Rhinatrema bivittatum]|uniref:coiled-coil domain-containing protein 114 isoform X2 n=1 Tax=Rhinatrema bivittatum TaxID=194408 RepID=UPI0011267EF1|nr:coiled-coil domain-containing protein 114 isoform X2 [Rhinatrema bivittatum]
MSYSRPSAVPRRAKMPHIRPGSSLHSEASEMDFDSMAETDLAKLQCKFRLKEGDRQAYSMESQDLIRRQLTEIQALEKEQRELQKNLEVAGNRGNQLRDQESQDTLRSLLEQKDRVEEQLNREMRFISDLEREIRIWEKKVMEQQKQAAGSGGPLRHTAHMRKNIEVSENRLDRATTKFNSQLVKNAALRKEIDVLRVDRSRFEQLYRKLEKELRDTRKEISDVIDDSTAAYTARDEAQNKMLLLKEKVEKDVAQHGAEVRELQRVLDHDRKLKEFMGIKTQERIVSAEVLEARRKRERVELERKKKDPRAESMETYQAAFQHIQTITGEDNLDILVERFIEVEDRNFALFNYVNEQNNETEVLQGHIAEIKGQIENFKTQGARLDEDHKSILLEIKAREQEARMLADGYEEHLKGMLKIIEQLKIGIDSTFRKLRCNRALLDDMLGTAAIRDSGIVQYLGLIEYKTNELLAARSYLDSKNFDKPYSPEETALILLGQLNNLSRESSEVQPPSTGEECENESEFLAADEVERPLTHLELRELILRGGRQQQTH